MEIRQNSSHAQGQNDPWQEAKDRLRYYEEMMRLIHGLDFHLDFAVDFRKAGKKDRANGNDHLSAVFLAKTITDIQLCNDKGVPLPSGADPASISSVIATYHDHLQVKYTPANQAGTRPQSFEVLNLALDYQDEDHHAAEQAILERANAALILAHNAKAAGWRKIDFGNTQDPLERYLLKKACDLLGIDCSSEKVSNNPLPNPKAYASAEIARDQVNIVFAVASGDILKSAVIPPEKKYGQKQSAADVLDSLGLNLNVA